MGFGQSALLRNRRLGALLEGSAVCDTPEDSGDKLGIILVTEPEEQLILLGKVEIETGVKGIAVFKQLRGVGEIAEQRGSRRIGIQVQQRDGVLIQPPGRELVQAATSQGKGRGSRAAGAERIADKPCRGRL